jgi:hypothetical protein
LSNNTQHKDAQYQKYHAMLDVAIKPIMVVVILLEMVASHQEQQQQQQQ